MINEPRNLSDSGGHGDIFAFGQQNEQKFQLSANERFSSHRDKNVEKKSDGRRVKTVNRFQRDLTDENRQERHQRIRKLTSKRNRPKKSFPSKPKRVFTRDQRPMERLRTVSVQRERRQTLTETEKQGAAVKNDKNQKDGLSGDGNSVSIRRVKIFFNLFDLIDRLFDRTKIAVMFENNKDSLFLRASGRDLRSASFHRAEKRKTDESRNRQNRQNEEKNSNRKVRFGDDFWTEISTFKRGNSLTDRQKRGQETGQRLTGKISVEENRLVPIEKRNESRRRQTIGNGAKKRQNHQWETLFVAENRARFLPEKGEAERENEAQRQEKKIERKFDVKSVEFENERTENDDDRNEVGRVYNQNQFRRQLPRFRQNSNDDRKFDPKSGDIRPTAESEENHEKINELSFQNVSFRHFFSRMKKFSVLGRTSTSDRSLSNREIRDENQISLFFI